MKSNKLLIFILTTLCFGLLVACKSKEKSSNSVKLDFLIQPEKIVIYSGDRLKELNEIEEKAKSSIETINEKYDDFSKITEKDMKNQEKINNQVMEKLDDGKIIEDSNRIENIFNQLKELEGIYVDSFDEEIITRMDLVEDLETQSIVSEENAYLRTFLLLKDGNMIIPKVIVSDSKAEVKPTGEMKYIKVKLPQELKDELEELSK